MPKPPDREPIPAGTPGIAKYKLQTETAAVTLHIEKFSLGFRWRTRKIEAVLEMLEKKAQNSLPQEQHLFLPKDTTRSVEALARCAKLIVQGKRVEENYGEGGFLIGYRATSVTPGGRQHIELLEFLPNGVMIQLFAERGIWPWLENLRGEVSVICSDKVSPGKAREHLEVFVRAPY